MKKTFITKINKAALSLFFVLCILGSVLGVSVNIASAQSGNEIYYFDDTYMASESSTYIEETISFSYISVEEFAINAGFPKYYNTNNSIYNVCAPAAGATIVGYYTRYYSQLIPGFEVGYINGDNYYYYHMLFNLTYTQTLIDTLYQNMSTNNPTAGTTQAQYKTGLTTYVNGKGKNISFTLVMSGSSLNITEVKSQLTNNKPVSLFLSGYNLIVISQSADVMRLYKNLYGGNHIMIAYGYKIIKYYNSANQNFRTDTFLLVSSGLSSVSFGYYRIGESNTVVNSAESANIS